MRINPLRGRMRAMARRTLTAREEKARRVLVSLMGVTDVKDAEMAQRISTIGNRQLSRQAITQRRDGTKPLDLRDIDECAEALSVPVSLFDGDPIDAVRWVLDNRPDLLVGSSGWLLAA